MMENGQQSKDEGAVKYDAGKIGVHLLPWPALQEIAKVLDFGALKYAPNNWTKGMSWSRLARGAENHIGEWLWREDKDPESKLSHLAHAGCCILFLLTYELFGLGTDDRHQLKRPDSHDSAEPDYMEGCTCATCKRFEAARRGA
jgi:hypothetical protein